MRVIICGGRDFNNYPFMCQTLDKIFSVNKPDVIISGGQRTEKKDERGNIIDIYGADFLGELYSWRCNINLERYPADWLIGRKAGPMRNEHMARLATHCIAFWDGKSRGTADMIKRSRAHKLFLRIVTINP